MANMNFGVNILPKANNTYTLGNSDYKWNIFANTLNGVSLTNVITDIQIDGTSIVSNNIANIPIAGALTLGLVKLDSDYGISANASGRLYLIKANSTRIKEGTSNYFAITPYNQHESVFYGLAKAAGDSTQSASSNTVGTYTSQAQSAIRNMLAAAPKSSPFFTGAISLGRYNNKTDQSDEANTIGFYSIAVGNNIAASGESSQAFGSDTYAAGWASHAEGSVTAAHGNISHTEGIYTLTEDGAWASHAEGSDTIANTPCVHVSGQYNSITDLSLAPTWTANTSYTVGDIVKHEETNDDDETRNYVYRCITANNDATFDYEKWITWQDVGDFVEIIGNGGYINDDEWTELRSNARALDWQGNEYLNGYLYVGCNANSSNGIRIPHDIQINNTSIVSNGIANIPIADTNTFGVMKIGDRLGLSNDNKLYVRRATIDQIKAGTTDAAMISAQYLDSAAFYGLAKAAGDSTQSASSNAVGVYTDSAKTAIQSMLDIPTTTSNITNDSSFVSAGFADGGLVLTTGTSFAEEVSF